MQLLLTQSRLDSIASNTFEIIKWELQHFYRLILYRFQIFRELCLNQGQNKQHLKAVTIGGAVISKAGTMTGGVTREDGTRAGRCGEREVEKFRKRKDKIIMQKK